MLSASGLSRTSGEQIGPWKQLLSESGMFPGHGTHTGTDFREGLSEERGET